MTDSKTVVVTGASGFIGKRIVKELLEHGYQVRGSVRSDAKAEQTRAAVGPDGLDRLSFVHLDLNSDEGWAESLAGADALLHTASPFPLATPKDPQEIIRPAVDGTLRAMRAAKEAGIERVVVTSSCVAIYNDTLEAGKTAFDHTNWSPTEQSFTSAYDDSKTLAERAAWDFVRDEAPEIGLSTVNPGGVWGVPLDEHYGTSLAIVERLLNGDDPMLPNVSLPITDVSDVAAIHRVSLENDAAIGERLPAAKGQLFMPEMAKILNDNIASSKAKTRVAPNFLLRLMARFNDELKSVAPRLGKSSLVSSANTEEILGRELIGAEEALLASARFLTES
ncbi:MAG: SDR family NAD(P)-dependent oxidoreductase [Actinomycetota bacterium]